MSPLRAVRSLLLLAFLTAAAPAPQFARQADALTVEIAVGFGGFVQADTWTPVRVSASNDGPDVSGELRLTIESITGSATIYTYPIDLPRGSRKLVWLYPGEIPNFARVVTVELVVRRQVVASDEARIQFVAQTRPLVGVWSDSPGALASLGDVRFAEGAQDRVLVVNLSEDDLPPTAPAWSALDFLVIADTDTGQLTAEQSSALSAWVGQGGRLIIVGGPGASGRLGGVAGLSPVTVSADTTASLSPLSTAVGEPFVQNGGESAQVATGALSEDGQVLFASEGIPLTAWRQVGAGRVDFFAADPALEPLRSWPAMSDLWAVILSEGSARPGWGYGWNANWQSAQQAVGAVPGISLPSILMLCGFLAVYVILIGPVNYFLLWRLKRRELAWVTIPALVLLFSGVAYLTGFQLRGSQVILHRLAVVQSWPGSDSARVDVLMGVWSPRRTGYDIELEPGFLARPMPRDLTAGISPVDQRIEYGETTILRRVQVDVGSIQPYVIAGYTTQVPRITGQLEVEATSSGLRLTGDVINNSDVDLHTVSLLAAGGYYRLADLPAGGVIHVDQVVGGVNAAPAGGGGLEVFPQANPYYGGSYSYSPLVLGISGSQDCYTYSGADLRACNLVGAMLNSESWGSGVYLTAWGGDVPMRSEVLNATYETIDLTLHVSQLEVSPARGGSALSEIPPGLMTWRVLDAPPNTYYSYAPYDLYLDPGQEITFQFRPVALVTLPQITGLILHFESYGLSGPQLSLGVWLWNYTTGQWDHIMALYGDNLIQGATSYVGPGGAVTVRVANTTQGQSVTLNRLDVTLTGD